MDEFGWMKHTANARVTELRTKRHFNVVREKVDGESVYRIL